MPSTSAAGKQPPRGVRNNSALNLRDFGIAWDGRTGADKDGYTTFSDPVYGIRAAAMDLLHDWQKGKKTVLDLIFEFAPPADGNPTGAYASSVSKALGVRPDEEIDLTDRTTLVKMLIAMSKVELGGSFYAQSVFEKGADLALAKKRIKPRTEAVKETGLGVTAAAAIAEPIRQGLDLLQPLTGMSDLARYAFMALAVALVGLGVWAAVRRK